ncbi:MAG: DHH family phosphoesterase [Planctomycetes bacterium]|nr:DHH family phosphoesterase [Planctomycetota bacterium]MBL7038221.1 DHH family phosphoesterase [Pirellulaceae bacterium]
MAKSDRLLTTLDDFDRFFVVMHDNPDPDAIATGWGIRVLVREILNKPARVIGGGAIVRAENRHMLDLLQPPIELVDDADVPDGTATILVDCGSESTNHLLIRKNILPVAVIDHHISNQRALRLAFRDVRPNVAASATIAASYLREQNVEPGAKLATAMVYALRTETRGCETRHSRLDRAILTWLTERAEPALLAEIETAPLSREYFGDLALAIQNAFVYDDVALCFLPRAYGAEIVGEVADLLIRCRGIRRVLCAAVVGTDLFFSARTETDSDNAAQLLRATLNGLGGAGGHDHRAGGKIADIANGSKIAEDLNDELRRRWLAACGVDRKRGTRLIPKRQIVDNL